MLGLPYERLEDIFKTIAMNKLCKTDVQSLGTFYPYKGTPIRRMLLEKGLLNEENEKQLLKGYDFNTLASGGVSVLRFGDMDMNDAVLTKMNYLFANCLGVSSLSRMNRANAFSVTSRSLASNCLVRNRGQPLVSLFV